MSHEIKGRGDWKIGTGVHIAELGKDGIVVGVSEKLPNGDRILAIDFPTEATHEALMAMSRKVRGKRAKGAVR